MSEDITTLNVKNKRKDERKIFLAPPPYEKCRHFNGPFVIDEDAGTCTCKECGETVSPMFVLKRLMHKESQWRRNRENYIDEMKRLKARSKTKCQHCKKMTQISHR